MDSAIGGISLHSRDPLDGGLILEYEVEAGHDESGEEIFATMQQEISFDQERQVFVAGEPYSMENQ